MKSTNMIKQLIPGILLAFGFMAMTPAFAGDVEEFEVEGLKVILKQSPKEVISASLFVEGGVTNYAKQHEGIENIAFQSVITGGTKSLDKNAFSTAAEQTGTRFLAETTFDYGTINMTAVKMFWDRSWKLFADAIMNPAFDETEFELLQKQMLTAAQSNMADPDQHLRNIAMKSTFGGSAYENIPAGTPESLSQLTLEDVSSYYKDLMGKKRIYLVVVGDVDKADLEAKIKGSLANLPDGSPAQYEERMLIEQAGSYLKDREIATNYIRGLLSAPTIDTQDGVAMWVAMSILRDRFFLELRTKRSLTYAPGAFYSTGVLKNPYNGLYVSTTDPKQSIEVMIDEVNKVKTEGFTPTELKNKKQTFLTRHYMTEQSTGAQARALGSAELMGGWEMSERLTERVNDITLEEMNRVFEEYSKTIRWTYLGKADMVEAEDFKQPNNELKIQELKD